MELHSLTGRPVGDPDLRVRPVGGRPALSRVAADRRRALHLEAGDPQQIHYASCIVVPIGFGITRDSWLNADPDYNLLQFAAAILIGLTGAGYALRRQVRRDADKVAKSNDAHD